MSVILSDKYLMAREMGFVDQLIIAPPENVPELAGYILKISVDKVNINPSDHKIELHDGNKWDKKLYKFNYMFEKAEKIKGKPSKQYHYTEEELIILYGSAKSSTFRKQYEQRTSTFSSGSGSLVRCKYVDFNLGHEVINWLIAPDSCSKWAYELDYDPLRDAGKHDRDAKGFKLLDEYHVDDISIFVENRQLQQLLLDFEDTLKLKLGYGIIEESGLTNRIIDEALQFIPDEVRFQKLSGSLYETKYAKELKEKLATYCADIKNECKLTIETCRHDKLNELTNQIKELIGIDVKFNN
ncbi:MAG: hypothetical protein K5894_11610 [Lachnospiraceae bacterium]|nr:hypothetical protein [Lachnospiraceae bacterium]